MAENWVLVYTKTTPGTSTINFIPAKYRFVMRGAGGAGGGDGKTAGAAIAKGGAGGKGSLVVEEYTFSETTPLTLSVGEGGLFTGGNGGAGGIGGSQGANGGQGGGGGYPTYLYGSALGYIFAQGGAGGGGGGGSGIVVNSRYVYGCGGGGGGGRYYLDTASGDIISVPGKVGANSHNVLYGQGYPGVAGDVITFPDIYSGHGGTGGDLGGERVAGGAGASGGGASGGAGGANGKNADYSFGGAGGGGAGGDMDAGGGAHGNGRDTTGMTDAYNHHVEPTDTVEENLTYGINGNYGIGGTPNSDGECGFIAVFVDLSELFTQHTSPVVNDLTFDVDGTLLPYKVSSDSDGSTLNISLEGSSTSTTLLRDSSEDRQWWRSLQRYIKPVTFTINPSPSDATVQLTANNFSQVGNSIIVEEGTTVHYIVSKNDYVQQSGDVVVNSTQTMDIKLLFQSQICYGAQIEARYNNLLPGEYRIIGRGGGGQGGAKGNNTDGVNGGNGGRGAFGEMLDVTVNVDQTFDLFICSGQRGSYSNNAGNGGQGSACAGGVGGSGGYPSYAVITKADGSIIRHAAQGGGGGGGGGGPRQGGAKYSPGLSSGGGGGGGKFIYNTANGTISNYAGANGGGTNANGGNGNGIYSNLHGGHGGASSDSGGISAGGGAGGTGGGAGGGGGGQWASSHHYKSGGGGGGGAGGDNVAGGGDTVDTGWYATDPTNVWQTYNDSEWQTIRSQNTNVGFNSETGLGGIGQTPSVGRGSGNDGSIRVIQIKAY